MMYYCKCLRLKPGQFNLTLVIQATRLQADLSLSPEGFSKELCFGSVAPRDSQSVLDHFRTGSFLLIGAKFRNMKDLAFFVLV